MMASDDSVQAIKQAIVSVYAGRKTSTRAKKSELIAAAGVSQKTFYRVLQDHRDVAALLLDVESVFLGKPTDPEEVVSSDPLRRDPVGAANELLGVVASLVSVVEEQRVHIQDLELALSVATDPEKSNHPAPPSLSAARARHEGAAGNRSGRREKR